VWTLPVKIAVAVVSIGMMLSGCREVVSHPIPPLAARAQVSTLPATSSLPYTAR
jgi:hypothetical protein